MTDARLFEAFVRRFQDMVFGTAVRLLGNAAEAEDVAQTVFLRAFERFAEVGDSPTAAGWLKTVTTNLCLTHLTRYRARWRLFSELDPTGDDASAEGFAAGLPAANVPTGEELDTVAEHAQLEQALRQLPDHQRVPIVLFHFEQQSYQDIAGTLRVSLAKVKTDIHRGRETLRKQLVKMRERS